MGTILSIVFCALLALLAYKIGRKVEKNKK